MDERNAGAEHYTLSWRQEWMDGGWRWRHVGLHAESDDAAKRRATWLLTGVRTCARVDEVILVRGDEKMEGSLHLGDAEGWQEVREVARRCDAEDLLVLTRALVADRRLRRAARKVLVAAAVDGQNATVGRLWEGGSLRLLAMELTETPLSDLPATVEQLDASTLQRRQAST